VLTEIIRVLAPEITAVLQQKHVEYSVAETDVLLGELKQHRRYASEEVFLSAQVFVNDFGEAVAVFLHEHAHVFGYDGSRGFTDALTQLIENVVRHRKDVDSYEAEWLEARKAVLHERNQRPQPDQRDAAAELVGSMNETQLRGLLKRLPTAAVWRALQEQTT
jgi:hypothetical protein